MEAELLQRLYHLGVLEVLGHHLGAGRQAGLDPRLRVQAALDRLAGQQARRQHHRRIGRVGAAGDGGDHHVAVPDLDRAAGRLRRGREARVDGGEPGRRALGLARAVDPRLDRLASLLDLAAQKGHQRLAPRRLRLRERHAVLRPLGPGQRRNHVAEIELEGGREARLRRRAVAEQPLLHQVALDVVDVGRLASAEAQVGQRLLVDREEAHGRAVLRRHVGDRGAVRQRQRVEPVAVELDELADHAALAQHLGHGQHQVGGGGSRRQLAIQLEADHLGQEHRHRLAQHGGLCLDAAHAPADHAERVDHGGVRIGADQRVREGAQHAVLLLEEHHAGQVLEVDLVHDAGAGRHHAQAVERLLAPAQELIALAVALVLELDVAPERHRLARRVDLHRVIDDQVGRSNRAHQLRRAAQLGEGLAHGGQIHHRRHAGEVLQDDAGRAERDLAGGRGRRIPARHRLDVLAGHALVVLVAQEVLEQDAQREGQGVDVPHVCPAYRVQAEDLGRAAVIERNRRLALEAVTAHQRGLYRNQDASARPSPSPRRLRNRRRLRMRAVARPCEDSWTLFVSLACPWFNSLSELVHR